MALENKLSLVMDLRDILTAFFQKILEKNMEIILFVLYHQYCTTMILMNYIKA
jgi:hypothetical protein